MSGYSIALRDQLMAQALEATEDLARPSWGAPARTYADGINDAVAVVIALVEAHEGAEPATATEITNALRALVAPQ
jgi:hypothetical protein